MKILKSYYKTPSFLTGRCIVSLTILGLISCSDRNGKSLSEATNDPAGIYREYLEMANHCLKLRTILPEYTGSICTIYDVRKILHFKY